MEEFVDRERGRQDRERERWLKKKRSMMDRKPVKKKLVGNMEVNRRRNEGSGERKQLKSWVMHKSHKVNLLC